MNETLGFILQEQAVESKPDIKFKNDKLIRFNTVLQEGDELNRNNRRYPTKILSEGLQDAYIKERIATDGWVGECGHPITTDPARLSNIDHTRISHLIKKCWMEGSKVMGLIETAVTPHGTDMMNLAVHNKMKLAFSMRGFSKVVENTANGSIVKGPLKIFTYDCEFCCYIKTF